MVNMILRNGIPLDSIIIESSVAIIILIFTILTYLRYRKKRSLATLYLTLTNLLFTLAAISSATGKFIDFTFISPQESISYSGFTINIAYCFVLIGNIFIFSFVETFFKKDNDNHKYIVSILCGILVGVILAKDRLESNAYSNMLIFLILMVVISFYIYIDLLKNSLVEIRNTKEKLERYAFLFISLYAIFLTLIFLFFISDLILIQLTGNGYNIEYYFGWISAAIAAFFGYLGYIMPNWLRNLIEVK